MVPPSGAWGRDLDQEVKLLAGRGLADVTSLVKSCPFIKTLYHPPVAFMQNTGRKLTQFTPGGYGLMSVVDDDDGVPLVELLATLWSNCFFIPAATDGCACPASGWF